jgi:hypothetical protein
MTTDVLPLVFFLEVSIIIVEVKSMNTKIKKLTSYQEKIIIQTLMRKHIKHLGYGSSRIVFPWGDKKVVKIAISKEGIAQNQAELECFDLAEPNMLTNIYCYGELVLIAEKVSLMVDANEEDYDSLLESLYKNEEDEVAKQLEKTIDFLENHFGMTSDNLQLGQNREGYIVSLDYGFESRLDNDDNIGNVSDLLGTNTDRAILKIALENLHLIVNGIVPTKKELDKYFLLKKANAINLMKYRKHFAHRLQS